MAPPGAKNKNPPNSRKTDRGSSSPGFNWNRFQKQYLTVAFVKSLVFDPARLPVVTWIILGAELFLNVFVVQNVNYTEIDWKAYMQECEGFLNGTTNYALLKGELS